MTSISLSPSLSQIIELEEANGNFAGYLKRNGEKT